MTAPILHHHKPSETIGACWQPGCTRPATVYAVYPNGALSRTCKVHERTLPGVRTEPVRFVRDRIWRKLAS